MKKLTTEEFIERAKFLHGDRYDYSKVNYSSMHDNVTIICRLHGEFFQTPNNHLKGHGCTICRKYEERCLLLEDVLSRFIDAHGNKYDYSQVEYVNSKTPVKIICPVHGEFYQKPEKHMSGQGCPKCRKNHKHTLESFVACAREVHGNLYDYSKVVYKKSIEKVCIIDKEYGEFWQRPDAHLRGEGHPLRKAEKCYRTKKKNHSFHVSKPEAEVYEVLKCKFGENNVLREFRSEKYPFACDFYIPSLDVYIELNIHVTHGFHWFDEHNEKDLERLELLKQRSQSRSLYEKMIYIWTVHDLKKREFAVHNNLNYLVFWKDNLEDFYQWFDNFDETHILNQF